MGRKSFRKLSVPNLVEASAEEYRVAYDGLLDLEAGLYSVIDLANGKPLAKLGRPDFENPCVDELEDLYKNINKLQSVLKKEAAGKFRELQSAMDHASYSVDSVSMRYCLAPRVPEESENSMVSINKLTERIRRNEERKAAENAMAIKYLDHILEALRMAMKSQDLTPEHEAAIKKEIYEVTRVYNLAIVARAAGLVKSAIKAATRRKT